MTALTYRQAAKRVRRSVRTIKRWRKAGMPMALVGGFRVVDEDVLLAWWRDRLNAWPPHQYRLRKARETGAHRLSDTPQHEVAD